MVTEKGFLGPKFKTTVIEIENFLDLARFPHLSSFQGKGPKKLVALILVLLRL